MLWRTLILAACVTLPLASHGCDKKRERQNGLIGRWQVVEQQRSDRCSFTATELQIFPDGRIKMSNVPQSDMLYMTDIAPDHFERLKKKYPNIEQGSTIVVVVRQQPKNTPMMGMAYRYLLKDRDTLIMEYSGCRPTTYKRAQ